MAFNVVSYKNAGNSNASSLTVDKPNDLAVGDLMLASLIIQGTGANFTLPSGFTETKKTSNVRTHQLSWKVSDSNDVAASNFQFSWDSGTQNCSIHLIRITGADTSSPIVASSGQANSSPSGTCTAPALTGNGYNLLFFFASSAGLTVSSASGYAVATTNPSWTELYDNDNVGSSGQWSSAAYGIRDAATSTGAGTATLDVSEENHGLMVAITMPPNTSVSPDVLTLSASIQEPTVAGDSNVSLDVLTLTASIQEPTVSTLSPTWLNPDKTSAPSWTNPDKT